MVRKKEEFRKELKEGLRGGAGTAKLAHLFDKDELLGKCEMCAIVELEQGASVGEHSHIADAELVYVLEGEVTTTQNGTKKVLKPGDASFIGGGNTHSTVNLTDRPTKVLAVVIR